MSAISFADQTRRPVFGEVRRLVMSDGGRGTWDGGPFFFYSIFLSRATF